MKRQPIIVAGRVFGTQKELLTEAQRLLNVAYKPGERVSLQSDHNFMVGFLARHPDADLIAPKPISHFEIRLHKIDDSYPNSLGFYVVMNDDSESTFSIYRCVDQKRSTQTDKITFACRMAIIKTTNRFKVAAFRDTETVICAIRPRKNFAGGWEFATPEAAQHFVRFHDRRAILRIAKRKPNISAGSHGYKSTFVEPPRPEDAP